MWEKSKVLFGHYAMAILIGFVFGFAVAGYATYYYHKIRMDEATVIGAFVFDKQIYEVKKRL